MRDSERHKNKHISQRVLIYIVFHVSLLRTSCGPSCHCLTPGQFLEETNINLLITVRIFLKFEKKKTMCLAIHFTFNTLLIFLLCEPVKT